MSKLIFRMFALDFHKVRSIVGEGLDVDRSDEASSRKSLQEEFYEEFFKLIAK